MSDFFKLLQEADIASLRMEKAKFAVDTAKDTWEKAKEEFEDSKKVLEKVLFKADEMAIPRQRIRKLIEDRTQALVASGLMEADAATSGGRSSNKSAKKPKASPKKSDNASEDIAPAELN